MGNEPLNASIKAPRDATKPVIQRYQHQQRVNANTLRLRALVQLFRLSPSDIAKATGVSRPYVARLLSLKDDFQGSPVFFRTLEAKLGTIIEGRSGQYFTVPAVAVRRVEGALAMAEQQVVERTA